MFCFNCGAQLPDNSKFCGVCGTVLSNNPSPAQQAPVQGAPVPPVAPYQGAPVPPAAPSQGAPVPPFAPSQGAPVPPAAPSQGVPVPPVQGMPDQGIQMPQFNAGDPNQFPGAQFSNGPVPFGDPQQGMFGNMPDNSYQNPNPGMPGQQNVFGYGQQPDPRMPINGFAEPAPMIYSQPAAPRPKKPVKKLKLSVSSVLAVVFCLFSFIFGIYAFVGGSVRTGIESGELSAGVKELELGKIVVGDILMKDGILDIAEKNDLVLPEKRAEKATVAQIAALTVNSTLTNSIITEGQVNEIIKESNISKELSKLVKAYEEYILTGDTDEFDRGLCEAVKEIVKKTEPSVYRITGLTLTENYEEPLDRALEKNSDKIEGILPDETLDGVTGIVGIVLSPVALIAALVLSLLLVFLEWLITKRVPAALITGGVAYTLIGAVLIAANIIISNLSVIPVLDYTVVEKTLSPIIYNAFGIRMLIGGLITAGVGVALIAVFIVLEVISKKRSATEPEPAE